MGSSQLSGGHDIYCPEPDYTMLNTRALVKSTVPGHILCLCKNNIVTCEVLTGGGQPQSKPSTTTKSRPTTSTTTTTTTPKPTILSTIEDTTQTPTVDTTVPGPRWRRKKHKITLRPYLPIKYTGPSTTEEPYDYIVNTEPSQLDEDHVDIDSDHETEHSSQSDDTQEETTLAPTTETPTTTTTAATTTMPTTEAITTVTDEATTFTPTTATTKQLKATKSVHNKESVQQKKKKKKVKFLVRADELMDPSTSAPTKSLINPLYYQFLFEGLVIFCMVLIVAICVHVVKILTEMSRTRRQASSADMQPTKRNPLSYNFDI